MFERNELTKKPIKRTRARYPDNVTVGRAGSAIFSAWVAQSWWQRYRGLFAFEGLLKGCPRSCSSASEPDVSWLKTVDKPAATENALLLTPCSSVHSFFLGYDIDVIFLSKHNRVLKCVSLKRNRLVYCSAAHGVLECASGVIQQHRLSVGDQLAIGRCHQPHPKQLLHQQLQLKLLTTGVCHKLSGNR